MLNAKRERGFVTVQWVLGIAFSMAVLVVLVNFIMIYLFTGMTRSALNEAVRNGSRGAVITYSGSTPTQPEIETSLISHCNTVVSAAFGSERSRLDNQVQLESPSSPCQYDTASHELTATVTYCPHAWLPSLTPSIVLCGDGSHGLWKQKLSASARAEYAQ
jgi:hypothetical protein